MPRNSPAMTFTGWVQWGIGGHRPLPCKDVVVADLLGGCAAGAQLLCNSALPVLGQLLALGCAQER